jgi:transglutaminase/protease-like cytokinesis protein 3
MAYNSIYSIGEQTVNITHHPLFSELSVQQAYGKDREIKYVCTTDLRVSDRPVDVYYSHEPHPEFGNHYFGLYQYNGDLYICDASQIEHLRFAMIQDSKGSYHYSRSHHDYNKVDTGFIDGGREYIRCSTYCQEFKVVKGVFCEA